jgi:hypothetical protein
MVTMAPAHSTAAVRKVGEKIVQSIMMGLLAAAHWLVVM